MNRTTPRTARPAGRATAAAPQAPLRGVLLGTLCLGLVAMASLPAARGHSAALGWMPLWLVGMPLIALAMAAWLARADSVRSPVTSRVAAARWSSGQLAGMRRRLPRDPARRPSLPRAA
jgi:predicted lipid-binding transport protein (Tim44 family)